MKSQTAGTSISEAEVTNIDSHGVWVYATGKAYFLPYEGYPWFKNAQVNHIINIERHHGFHLYWPDLDVDLSVESLEKPRQYPLVAGGGI